jgi:hypothetical protein
MTEAMDIVGAEASYCVGGSGRSSDVRTMSTVEGQESLHCNLVIKGDIDGNML